MEEATLKTTTRSFKKCYLSTAEDPTLCHLGERICLSSTGINNTRVLSEVEKYLGQVLVRKRDVVLPFTAKKLKYYVKIPNNTLLVVLQQVLDPSHAPRSFKVSSCRGFTKQNSNKH